MCGCLGLTRRAKTTNSKYGHIKGEHLRYIPGHQNHKRTRIRLDPGPNPSGLCMCGCGEPTAISKRTTARYGHVAGTPQRYIAGHQLRHAPRPVDISAAERYARDALIAEDYRQGDRVIDIAEKYGLSSAGVSGAVTRWRETVDPTLPRRRVLSPARILERLEDEGRISKRAARLAVVAPVARGTIKQAERNAELAALMAEQEHDAEHGDRAWDISLDAPIGDGGSLHDVLRAA